MKLVLTFTAFAIMIPAVAAAERAKSPASATVFIRLVGSVHAEFEELGVRQTADRDHVEIGTGSGFVISPYGYILTNDHVVSNTELALNDGLARARVVLNVSKIEVCFPPEGILAGGLSTSCTEASVYAADPALDLAVLFVSTSNLPYLALGDSDMVTPGQPVEALGYPFGRQLDVGRVAAVPDLVPEVSTSTGAISALRAGEKGERRYLQISNGVNPGNSGGPLVDRDGFAVGVIRMRLTRAPTIAFAIPANLVKDFLDSHGLDHLMPVRRLRLGPLQSFDAKGVALRVPEGLGDISPFRSRVETDPRSADVALRVDRVLSPWSSKQIEQALVQTQAFESFSISTMESQIVSQPGRPPLLLGRATGIDTSGEMRMDYAVLDLGAEKLVARFVGPGAEMAFNAGVVRASLESLEGRRLIAGLAPVETLEWPASALPQGSTPVPIPRGWIGEPGAPSTCRRLPQPSAVTSALPVQDFTLALRLAIWPDGVVSPDQAASACFSSRGSLGPASYSSHGDWLGVSYSIEGTFVRLGNGQVVQVEVASPDAKSTYMRWLLSAWMMHAAE